MRELKLHNDYNREAVHDIFAPDTPFTPQAGTWGIQGIIEPPDRPDDFVLFVTFGKREGEHEFDEGISTTGVLRWQSQPQQKLSDTLIRRLIAHDESRHSIYLFLRTASRRLGRPPGYTYLGRLKYVLHDNQREQPVHFDWQLLDWPIPGNVLDRMELHLEVAAGPAAVMPISDQPPAAAGEWIANTVDVPVQAARHGVSTGQFRSRVRPDYTAREKTNRALGLAGEKLVLEHERQILRKAGRNDLADRVRHVAVDEGDGAGYDVLSFFTDGRHKYIEVKTTRGSITSDFFITPYEVAFATAHPEQYELRRLYAFDETKSSYSYYSIFGDVQAQFQLTPTEYKVSGLKA